MDGCSPKNPLHLIEIPPIPQAAPRSDAITQAWPSPRPVTSPGPGTSSRLGASSRPSASSCPAHPSLPVTSSRPITPPKPNAPSKPGTHHPARRITKSGASPNPARHPARQHHPIRGASSQSRFWLINTVASAFYLTLSPRQRRFRSTAHPPGCTNTDTKQEPHAVPVRSHTQPTLNHPTSQPLHTLNRPTPQPLHTLSRTARSAASRAQPPHALSRSTRMPHTVGPYTISSIHDPHAKSPFPNVPTYKRPMHKPAPAHKARTHTAAPTPRRPADANHHKKRGEAPRPKRGAGPRKPGFAGISRRRASCARRRRASSPRCTAAR